MSHRTSLVASIALTIALALGILTARARLFDSTTGGQATATPVTVGDTSADAIVSGEVQPAVETARFADERDDGDGEEDSLARGDRRDDDREDDHEDDEHDDDEHDDDDHEEDGEHDDD